jgi:hypothetical protein
MVAYLLTHPPRPFAGLALIAALLTGCSSPSTDPEEGANRAKDPPGAALALSIGGQAAREGEGLYDTSVNCAIALAITKERLAQTADNPASREVALLKRAEQHFTARAREAFETEDKALTAPAAAIAERRAQKADAVQEQAQLAIACLRRYGDDVGDAES